MASNIIPSDSPSVFAALSSSQQNAIAYPTPLPGGIAGLIFDWVGEERLELRADITDSWVEDNTAIQDQIALSPEKFVVDASTAEIVFTPGPAPAAPSQPANPFSLLGQLLPSLTPGAAASLAFRAINGAIPGVFPASQAGLTSVLASSAAAAVGKAAAGLPNLARLPPTLQMLLEPVMGFGASQSAAVALGSAADSADTAAPVQPSGLWGYYQSVGAIIPENSQATVMGFIYQLWKGRVLFTVETPWGIFDSMAIELADGTQPQDTIWRTDHRITFKKVRVVGELNVTPSTLLGRAWNQASEANPDQPGNIGQNVLSDQQVQSIMGNWTPSVSGYGPGP
jgi:hypothetical protein